MKDLNNKTAYIGIERDGNSFRYIAKVFDEPPSEISRAQYNAIVKSLGAKDWANNVEDETSIINQIIKNILETTEQRKAVGFNAAFYSLFHRIRLLSGKIKPG